MFGGERVEKRSGEAEKRGGVEKSKNGGKEGAGRLY